MATYEGPQVHVSAELVYTVPADWQFGSPWVEVEKAVAGMLNQLRDLGILGKDEHPADDLIRIQPRDEEIWVVATIRDGLVKDSRKALNLLAEFPTGS